MGSLSVYNKSKAKNGIVKYMQISEERFIILLAGTIRSIPFNIIVALLLTVELLYKKVPTDEVLIWLAILSIINLIRLASCYNSIKTKRYSKKKTAYLLMLRTKPCGALKFN